MKYSDEAIADPGVAGTKAAMAFQGPDVTVTVGPGPKPRRIEFDPTPPPSKKDVRLFPPSLAGRAIEFKTLVSAEADAAEWGLHWVRITKTHADGSPGGVVGLHGQFLQHGDEVQLPGNLAAGLVGDGSAVFLFEGSTKAEIEFLENARKMGYSIEAPRVPRLDRPEYAHVRKSRNKWMAGSLDSSPGTS